MGLVLVDDFVRSGGGELSIEEWLEDSSAEPRPPDAIREARA